MKTYRMIPSLLGSLALALGLACTPQEASAGNPVVDVWGSTSESYDPFNDHRHVRTDRTRVRASAYDPARGYVDPGSLRYVDRHVYDTHGRLVREFGWSWTSFGRPHGDLTRRAVTYYPGPGGSGTVHEDNDQVIYFAPGGNTSPGPGPGAGGVTHEENDRVIYFAPGGSKSAGGSGGVTREENDSVRYSRRGSSAGFRGRRSIGR